MNVRSILLASLLIVVLPSMSQPVLLPSIGVGAQPLDSDPICTLPTQTPPITSVGRPAGELAAEFNLFDINGNPFSLEEALALGKPVLMISASYTCPVFRGKIPSINNVVANYGALITTVIIYTVEAHPDGDISPYFGAVNTGAQNISAGILYAQPDTYGERKAVLQDMLDSLQINAPIYLDGPCNEWWNYYGPQPNNAYLIDTSGVIFAHHDWYDKVPDDIECDLDSLLGLPTSCDQTFNGQCNMQMVSNDTVYGAAGTTLYTHAILWNPTSEDVLIRVVKLQENLPAGWSTSLCLDVCYLPSVDTAIVAFPAGDSLHFYYYFYSTPGAATGFARVGLRNEFNLSNSFQRNLWGISEEASALPDQVQPALAPLISPNPTDGIISITTTVPYETMGILDGMGRTVLRSDRADHLNVRALPPGVYMLRLLSAQQIAGTARFVKR